MFSEAHMSEHFDRFMRSAFGLTIELPCPIDLFFSSWSMTVRLYCRPTTILLTRGSHPSFTHRLTCTRIFECTPCRNHNTREERRGKAGSFG